ncbi:MAG: sulfite exporter TauE/SafE family protein [Rhizobiaceae bacterium]
MEDSVGIAVIIATFFLAGTVKGVVGLGLPAISVGVLTAFIGLTEAMTLATIPAFLTNLWQAYSGDNGGVIVRRIWPFLLLATATVWFGSLALTRIDQRYLSALLGVLLALYAMVSLVGLRLFVPERLEMPVAIAVGALNGIFTGMTGAFSFPGVLYLQALGLGKDDLVQAMGMLFALSSAALGLSLAGGGFMDVGRAGASVLAMVPVAAGLAAGTRIRRRLSERAFRRLFFWSLLVLGIFIVAEAIR